MTPLYRGVSRATASQGDRDIHIDGQDEQDTALIQSAPLDIDLDLRPSTWSLTVDLQLHVKPFRWPRSHIRTPAAFQQSLYVLSTNEYVTLITNDSVTPVSRADPD